MGRSRSPENPRGRDRERRRRDGEGKRSKRSRRGRSRSPSSSRSRSQSRTRSRERKRRRDSSPPLDLAAARQQALAGHTAEEARQAEREREQRALDDEMEKRRKRIEAWQAQRRKLEVNEVGSEGGGAGGTATAGTETAAAAEMPSTRKIEEETAAIEGSQQKWNLEDDGDLSSEDEEGGKKLGDGSVAVPMEEDGIAGGSGGGLKTPADGNVGGNANALPLPKLSELRRQQEEEEEEDPLDAFMKQNEGNLASKVPLKQELASSVVAAAAAPTGAEKAGDSEVDPLDAFMAANVLPEEQKLAEEPPLPKAAPLSGPPAAAAKPGMVIKLTSTAAAAAVAANGNQAAVPPARKRRRPTALYDSEFSSDAGSSDAGGNGRGGGGGSDDDDVAWAQKVQAGKLSKGDKLGQVDHSQIRYPPFRRNFYIEVAELARMSDTEVEAYRKQLDGIKVRGKDVPKPLRNWNQAGLSGRVGEVLKRSGFERPLPIQAQAVPVIMGGRDCIGIAKTGSGKTLAFVLPMVRHVKDQPPLAEGDGPIALVMAPTRELVTQIAKEIKKFARAAGIYCTAVYGGSGVANQISELKRGTEIVVCTPGRMIDVLATGNGKITNLRRVTYLVMDEADRMFDMGFEPQIMRIVNNVRPDRQTVLFSATFPRSVEQLARKVLINPVEIQVGGRSVVNSDITQYVEIRPEEERFLRLLELLGQWYERGKLLIFVSSQDRCDALFRDLLRAGYPCLSLHGGKDQSDRESTISDFKSNVCNVLVATSVAARGLDVKDLVLVVNYDPPNHHEDYVHRVGRTGRAGAKGTAVTFIGPDEEQYAPDLVKALKESSAPIPADLETMASSFENKRKAGLAKAHGSGFGGTGFKFDRAEEDQVRAAKKATAKEFGIVEGSESEGEEEAGDGGVREMVGGRGVEGSGAVKEVPVEELESAVDISTLPLEVQARIKAAQAVAERFNAAPQAQAQAQAQLPPPQQQQQLPQGAPTPSSMAPTGAPSAPPPPTSAAAVNPMLAAAQAAAQRLAMKLQGTGAAGGAPTQQQQQQHQQAGQMQPPPPPPGIAPDIAAAAAAALQAMGVLPGSGFPAIPAAAATAAQNAKHYQAELEINDFPQQARWKVTHRETIRDISEQLGAAVVVKGRYTKPGAPLPEGERKLYLQIEGPTPDIVRKAKAEIKKLVEESTEKAMRREAPGVGRYSVM